MKEKHEIRFEKWLKEKRELAKQRGGREEVVNAFSIVLSMLSSIQSFEKREEGK